MHTETALSLLGPLASLAMQRRYIVGGTKDNYLVAEQLLDDADYFLQSTVSTGPATVETFERKDVAERLGAALGYVIHVERLLLEQNEIYPCFTVVEPAGWPPPE